LRSLPVAPRVLPTFLRRAPETFGRFFGGHRRRRAIHRLAPKTFLAILRLAPKTFLAILRLAPKTFLAILRLAPKTFLTILRLAPKKLSLSSPSG